jgi:hypothetical protein
MWPVRTDNNFIHVGTPAAAALPTRRAGPHRGLRADPIAQRAQRVEDDGDVDRLLEERALDRRDVSPAPGMARRIGRIEAAGNFNVVLTRAKMCAWAMPTLSAVRGRGFDPDQSGPGAECRIKQTCGNPSRPRRSTAILNWPSSNGTVRTRSFSRAGGFRPGGSTRKTSKGSTCGRPIGGSGARKASRGSCVRGRLLRRRPAWSRRAAKSGRQSPRLPRFKWLLG